MSTLNVLIKISSVELSAKLEDKFEKLEQSRCEDLSKSEAFSPFSNSAVFREIPNFKSLIGVYSNWREYGVILRKNVLGRLGFGGLGMEFRRFSVTSEGDNYIMFLDEAEKVPEEIKSPRRVYW